MLPLEVFQSMTPLHKDRLINKFRRHILENVFQAASLAARCTPAQISARRHCETKKDIPYHPDRKSHHLLDIYKPMAGKPPYPVLINIHGGGFTICSKETHAPVAHSFADRGFLVFNLNYRLAPRHRFPAALEDVCRAYGWVVENAERYGGDIHRIVVAGESAGANLALALTVACCYRRDERMAHRAWDARVVPEAALILCGYLQVSNPGRFAPLVSAAREGSPLYRYFRSTWNRFQFEIIQNVAAAYIGRSNDHPPPGCDLADPLTVLEAGTTPDRTLPAIFAMTGTEDPLLDDTRRLQAALNGKPAVHEVRYYTGEPHAFHLMLWRRKAAQFWKDCWRFLDRYVRN
jgi:acetyl esterase